MLYKKIFKNMKQNQLKIWLHSSPSIPLKHKYDELWKCHTHDIFSINNEKKAFVSSVDQNHIHVYYIPVNHTFF